MVSGICRHCNESIVSSRLLVFGLLGLNYSDELGRHQAPHKCRIIHQNENIEWITVFRLGRRNVAKIKRKDCPQRKRPSQLKHSSFCVVLEFVSTAFGRVDNGVDMTGVSLSNGSNSIMGFQACMRTMKRSPATLRASGFRLLVCLSGLRSKVYFSGRPHVGL